MVQTLQNYTLLIFFLFISNFVFSQSQNEASVLNQAKTTKEVLESRTKSKLALIEIEKKIVDLNLKIEKDISNSSSLASEKKSLILLKDSYTRIATRPTPVEEIINLEKSLSNPTINERNALALKSRIEYLKKLDK